MRKKARLVELVNGSVWLYMQRTIYSFNSVADALRWCEAQDYEVTFG